MMNLKSLSDDALLNQTRRLVADERRVTLEVLQLLLEVELRRLFAGLGYPSLFEYCVKELGYSEGSAQRRISSMRLMKDLPELESKISEGALSLSVLAQAQSFFRKEQVQTVAEKREVLVALERKSSRDAERELASRATSPEAIIQERIRAVSADQSELKVGMENALLEEIEELRGLLAHAHPGMSIAEALRYSVKLALEKHRPKAPGKGRERRGAGAKTETAPVMDSTPPPTSEVNSEPRFPDAETRRIVWHRDGGCCTYINSKTGRRCRSRYALQCDHIIPWAQGGRTIVANLRLLCRQHNQWEALQKPGEYSFVMYTRPSKRRGSHAQV